MAPRCNICDSELAIKKKLLYCPSCGIFIGSPEKYGKTYGKRDERTEIAQVREPGMFNFFRVLKITLFMVVLLGMPYGVYRVLVPLQTECIPVTNLYLLDDPELRKNVLEAMGDILEISPEDYYRLCHYGTKIELRDLAYYWGLYIDRIDSKSGERGVIALDRKMAGSYEHLDAVIVHEACHAYLLKEFDDSREAPCAQRGYDYIAKKSGVDLKTVEIPKHGGTEKPENVEAGEKHISLFARFRNLIALLFDLFVSLVPADVSAATPGQYNLREGDLISAAHDPDIYIVNEHGYKRLFLNPVIFGFYGHLRWENVREVTPQARDAFFTSGYFRNCEANDPKVYATEVTAEDAGALHWLDMSGEAAVAEDADFAQKVFCINNSEFSWYPKSSVYTSTAQAPKYDRRNLISNLPLDEYSAPKDEESKVAADRPSSVSAPDAASSDLSPATLTSLFFGSKVPCESNPNPVFQTGLTALGDVEYIVPPGSPSGDKIASHTYLKTTNGASIPLYAPADSLLIDGSYSGVDYALTLQVSCEMFYILGHFTDPIQKIKNAVASGDNPILMEFKAGEFLGYTFGTQAVNAFDFGLYHIDQSNNFVNKARYTADAGWSKDHNAVCPYDYFVDSLKTGYYAKFATLGGKIVPGAACRSASRDIAGSISGAWFSSPSGSNVVGSDRVIIASELDGGVIRIGATSPAGFRFPLIYSNNSTFKDPAQVTGEHCYSYSYADDKQIAYFKITPNTEMDVYLSSSTSTCPSAIPAGAKKYYR